MTTQRKYTIWLDTRTGYHRVTYAHSDGRHGHNGELKADDVAGAVAQQRRRAEIHGWLPARVVVRDAVTRETLTQENL